MDIDNRIENVLMSPRLDNKRYSSVVVAIDSLPSFVDVSESEPERSSQDTRVPVNMACSSS